MEICSVHNYQDKDWFDAIVRIVHGVGSVHNKVASLSWNLWRIYIRGLSPRNLRFKHLSWRTLIAYSRFDQSLKSSFLKPRGVSSWVWTDDIWQESDIALAPLYFICTLNVDTIIKSLDPKNFTWLIGSLDFGLSLVLEPSVVVCLIGAHVLHGIN